MDSQDQVQNVPAKDVSVDPNVAGQEPKEEDASLPADQVGENKEITSPESQSKSEEGAESSENPEQNPRGSSDKSKDNSKVSSQDKPEIDETPQKGEESLASETTTSDPNPDQVAEDEKTMPKSDSLNTDSQSKKEEESESSEAAAQAPSDQVAPTTEQTAVTDSQPKKDEETLSSDSLKQDIVNSPDQVIDDSEVSVPKESDSPQDASTLEENVDSPPLEEKDAVSSDVPLQIPKDQLADKDVPLPEETDSTQKAFDEKYDKEDSIVVIPDEQNQLSTSDQPVSNNVDNQLTNAVIPSTEINGSTMNPDKTNDTSTFATDDDGIPPKSNGTSSSSSSKEKNYCAENWLLVLAICLIILTIVAVIILAAIIIPILSQKILRPVRLPGNVIPEHYILEIRPILIPDHFGFDGSVVITVLCVNATNKLILHYNGLEIDENSVGVINLNGGHSPFVLKAKYDIENEFIIFSLCENLTVGTKYDVHIFFKGKFAADLFGFGMITYEKSGENKSMALTKFESIYARKAFPCFDEPALKATFDINLVRWKNMTSLSNMKRLATVERDKDWEIDMYQRSVPMSTYLVTFVVGDLQGIQKGKVAMWAPKDVDYYQYALNVTDALLGFYESYLQVPYSISKLDQLSAEDYRAGAMENWGVIIYHKDKIKSGVASDKGIARIISHELAHQWFGNLVTMKWWDELWLNEGFAAYFGYFGGAFINKEWKMEEVVEYIDGYMYKECSHSVGINDSITKSSETTKEIKGYLRSIIYKKGAALVRMMHMMLGDSVFRRGLKTYLKENSFKNVVQEDLWRSLTWAQFGENRIDMKKVMEPWTRQPFYPLITVTRNYRDHEALVEQTSCTNAFGTESKDLWPVPITWIDGTRADYRNTSVKLILSSERGTIRRLPGNEAWILMNVERLGYFRVNYDDKNWELLLWQLRHNYKVIPTLNRRQLILDALYFAKIKQLSHIITLDILTYYPFEKEEIVAKALFRDNSMHYYENMVKYGIAESYWKEFVHYLLKPIFIRYSRIWDEKDEEGSSEEFAWLAAGILCNGGYAPCILAARNKFKDLLKGNSSQISLRYHLQKDILCALARYATNEEWNNMNEVYKTSSRYGESSFLACTEDEQLFMRWAKAYLLSAEERKHHSISIRLSEERWENVVGYLSTHWGEIKKERHLGIMSGLILQPHNEKTLKMVKEFYELYNNDISKAVRKKIDRFLSDEARLIPSSDDILHVGVWLISRSWENIDIREIE